MTAARNLKKKQQQRKQYVTPSASFGAKAALIYVQLSVREKIA